MLYIFQYPLCIIITDCIDFTGSKARLLESRKKKRHILTSGKFHFTAHSVEITSKSSNINASYIYNVAQMLSNHFGAADPCIY